MKEVLVLDKDGNYTYYSPEEMMARRLNNWKGWKCSAGVESLHITSDGNIFTATCKVGGYLGNIFDSGVKFPDNWVTCTNEWCMCGTDMRLSKGKNEEFSALKNENLINYVEELKTPHELITMGDFEYFKHFPKNVTWDIGRRCNYSCSYCPPSTANNFEAYKSWKSLKHATDMILLGFCRTKKAKWVFTGGEPTINPAYMDLVKYIYSFFHIIHTQTNGSRSKDYFEELIQYSSIGFSIHFEGYNPEKVLENAKAIIQKKKENEKASVQWFGIRLMVMPGRVEEALNFYNKVKALEDFDKYASVNMSPIYKKYDSSKLMDYTKEELDTIIKYS